MKRLNTGFVFVFVLTLGMILPKSLLAQWSYQAGLYGTMDANPFGIYGAPAGSAILLTGGAEYGASSFGAGYFGRLTQYDSPSDLDAYIHQAYLSLGRDTTNVNFLAEQRVGTQTPLYDYLRIRSGVVHQFGCLGLNCSWQGGGSLIRFAELTDRDQQGVQTSLSASRSFQTRTSVITNVGVGYTFYSGGPSELVDVRKDNTVTHLLFGLRLAQSLTPTTGAAIFYRGRLIDGAPAQVYLDEDSGLSYSLIDDPSLYGTQSIGLEATQMLRSYSVRLRIGASYERRTYPSQGVYTGPDEFDFQTLRNDDRAVLWMNTSWDVRVGRQIVTLELRGQWLDNASNSYWYDFSSSYLSLGAHYSF